MIKESKEKNKMSSYTIEIKRDFNLDHIFDCGQCFRWEKEQDGSYTGVAFGKIVNMAYDEEKGLLTIENADDNDFNTIWRVYLDWDTDYGQIKDKLNDQDHVIRDATSYGHGIRILKQDPWETLISFIISQNNNIPRIKGCIEKLCSQYGQSLGTFKGKEYYSFPGAEVLAKLNEEDLSPIRLGYRAKYIIETAKGVASQGGEKVLKELAKGHVTTQAAFEAISEYKGVGPKVANCILLFGMGKRDSFPIDVWVARIMNHLYKIDEADKGAMTKYAKEHFKEYGGYAQQYLFYYARSLEELQKK